MRGLRVLAERGKGKGGDWDLTGVGGLLGSGVRVHPPARMQETKHGASAEHWAHRDHRERGC